METLYLKSDCLRGTAKVIGCEAYKEGYALELDQSLFHPQGGGQKGDVGKIGEHKIYKTIIDQGRQLHLSEQPVDLGDYAISINVKERILNTRLHSAGHLIAHYLCRQFSITPVKAHHWPNESAVTFITEGEFPAITEGELENQINQLIGENLPREMSFSKEGLRNISFGDFPAFPCGGTHVTELSQLGAVIILQMKIKKGKLKIAYDVSPCDQTKGV